MSIRALALLAAAVALLVASVTAVAAVKARTTPPADPYSWARGAAAELTRDGSWPSLAGDDLARDATRADLDTALAILGGRPIQPAATPPAPASIWTAHLLMTRALGLEPERRALERLATADGDRRGPHRQAVPVVAGGDHLTGVHVDPRREVVAEAEPIGGAHRLGSSGR